MFIIVGFVIVLLCTIGGFMVAGGNPISLIHLSEIIVIFGIATGVFVCCAPKSTLIATLQAISHALKGDGPSKTEIEDLLKMLYEIFLIGRRNGLIALDEHVGDPQASSIFSKYPSFLAHADRIEFLTSNMRPLIDGKVKPDQLKSLMAEDIHTKEHEGHRPVDVIHILADSLPGIGICAAVLGIIVTMGVLDQGASAVGAKVSAALTGSFMGVWVAYGFLTPLSSRLHAVHANEIVYFKVLSKAVVGFANGLAPAMAVEIARRAIGSEERPTADELEAMLKEIK